MARSVRSHFFFVSPWLLAAATALLVLIVVTFTLNNIQREKELMTGAMLQKGTTLIRIIGSGARAAYMADLRRGVLNMGSWDEYVQRIITHLGDDPDVRFLMVVDSAHRIIAHSQQTSVGTIAAELPDFRSFPSSERFKRIVFKTVTMGSYGKVFLVARPFLPFRPVLPLLSRHNRSLHGKQLLPDSPLDLDKFYRFHHDPDGREQLYTAVVGLDTRSYDNSLRQLRFQALMLSLTMLLVGLGGWLSLSAVQGYRVSQKALSDIQAFTGLLVSRLPVGIVAVNEKGRVSTWNQAAAEMIGPDPDQALGMELEKVLPAELAGLFIRPLPRQAAGDMKGEEINLTVNGAELILHCRLIELVDQDEAFRGKVLLLSDVTRIKTLESEMRENERLAAVGRMAAGVAHEVRNPLSSIKGLALLLKNKFSASSREFETTGLLIGEVERMNRTISELLSFARPASLDLGPVDLKELLRDTLHLVAADTAGERISISLDCARNLPEIHGDRDRLSQVFINILLNGVQAMEDGGALAIRVRADRKNQVVVIAFQDTGTGITSEQMAQVFFPYFTTKPGGTGIGLAISQKIVVDHGGSIRIDSEPGRGTTVFVELPLG
jgi:two-component system sensor histidine kinase HydH